MPNAMRADITGIVMMIEFDSLEVARRFSLSDDYQAAKGVLDA